MISLRPRVSRLRVPVIAAILGLLVVAAIAGCTSAKSNPKPDASSAASHATPPPTAVPYAGSCPAAESLSTAVGKTVSLAHQKPNGRGVECTYSGSHGTLVASFENNGGTTPTQLVSDLSQLVGHDKLTPIPHLGEAAYEYAAENKGITVIAINHGFTIDMFTTGLSAAATIKAEQVAVGVGGH